MQPVLHSWRSDVSAGTILGDVFVGCTIIALGLIRTDWDHPGSPHGANGTVSALDGRTKVHRPRKYLVGVVVVVVVAVRSHRPGLENLL